MAAVVSTLASIAAESPLATQVLWRNGPRESSSEIVAYDTASRRLFVSSGQGVEVLSAKTGMRLASLPILDDYHATSVAVSRGRVAVAWAAVDKRQLGRIVCYDSNTLDELASFTSGYHPDMIVFSPDGRYLLTANEGEPTDDYAGDPEGSITIVDTESDLKESKVKLADFGAFNSQRDALRERGIRIFGPSLRHEDHQATVAEDLEPEFIAVTPDSQRAWVTLQENNAIAEVDLEAAQVVAIHALGTKSFSNLGGVNSPWQTTGLDASALDGGARVRHWPVSGLFQPDGIAAFEQAGQLYLVTANEGDPRDYSGYHEACQLSQLSSHGHQLSPRLAVRFLVNEPQIAQLEVTTADRTYKKSEFLEQVECFGARSFSIWKLDAQRVPRLVFDSGNDFESIATFEAVRQFHENHHVGADPDARSCLRGPEPEGVVLGRVGELRLAVISLERTGGVMIYDVTSPEHPQFLEFLPPHLEQGVADCAPEGMVFIPAEESPTGAALLIVANEVSGTTTAYQMHLDR